MSYNISNAYSTQFDVLFHEMLRQRGSYLMPYVRYETVEGEVKTIRQFDTGDAIIGELSSSGITEYSPVLYDNRRVEPKPIYKSISLNHVEMIRQGQPPVDQLAATCSTACGSALDKLIISALGGTARLASSGDVALPTTQYVCCDTTQFGNEGTTVVGQGLTTQKVSFAVSVLREKYNIPQIVCVCSNRAMGQLMADERAASALFNRTQAMADGFMTPFAGVDFFVTSENMPTASAHKQAGGSIITADSSVASTSGTTVELAYIYAKEQLVLATSKDFELKSSEDPHRNFDIVFQCLGMFDAVRMQEESVVAIEVNTGSTVIA